MFRFNVDCTLATSFYSKNEGLFATSGGVSGGDSCPSLSPLPSSDCEGSVSSCWSPGQPDGDCPDFGLCCFDGCSNTCGECKTWDAFYCSLLMDPNFSAQAQVKAVPQTLPTTTTEGYDYEPPKVTLPVRPKKITTTTKRTTTPKRITTTKRPTTTIKTTTELELLYGAPRQGRNLSNR